MNVNPLQSFDQACDSILSLIRCADIYGLHAISLFRGETVDLDLIERIVKEKMVSLHAHSWRWSMREEDRDEFDKDGHLRSICEHIVFASYVAIEAYLIEKFKEYFNYMFKAPDQGRQGYLMKRFSFRSLEEINKNYSRFLGIGLAQFNHPQVSTYAEAGWFDPSSCWEGLLKLEACRNQLAHLGRMDSVKLVVLVDAISVYLFCRSYVSLFDANYDDFIYNGRTVRHEEKKR
jgi:hypothetical protein